MNWHPISSYSKLSGDVVESINVLLSRGRPIGIASGAEAYSIRPLAAQGFYNARLSLRIEVGGAATEVHLSPATLDAILSDLIPREAFETVADDLKLAVLEAALSKPLGALTEHLKTSVTLQAITQVRGSCPTERANTATDIDSEREPGGLRPSTPNSVLFEVRRQSDAASFNLQVDLLSALPGSVQRLLSEPSARRRRDFGQLPATVTFEMGTSSLSAREFQSLEPGDIVLFNQNFISERQLRVNIGDSIYMLANVDEFGLTIQSQRSAARARS